MRHVVKKYFVVYWSRRSAQMKVWTGPASDFNDRLALAQRIEVSEGEPIELYSGKLWGREEEQ